MTVTDQYHKQEVNYINGKAMAEANLQKWKVEQLFVKASVEFAKRIKDKECMYTREVFEEYLKAMADSIASSDIDTIFLLPAIQTIKDRVFGRQP